MPQTITRGIKALIDEANAEIETLNAKDAIEISKNGDVVIVDIRDPREIERDGRIPGAFACTRGMLEFWIDPQSPYAKPVFQEDKKFVFHCAGGLRSALAAKTAQDMGLKPVAHIAGGYAAWRDAGGPVEQWDAEEEGVRSASLSLQSPASFPTTAGNPVRRGLFVQSQSPLEYWIVRPSRTMTAEFDAYCFNLARGSE
ncbi:rhodanese-related sulfurtransferase [Bradyrhizobium sp. LM4.3]